MAYAVRCKETINQSDNCFQFWMLTLTMLTMTLRHGPYGLWKVLKSLKLHLSNIKALKSLEFNLFWVINLERAQIALNYGTKLV